MRILKSLKLYKEIDSKGLYLSIIGILLLLTAIPIHYYLISLEGFAKESFIDRIASLSLVCFLISEFRLNSKINSYIYENIELELKVHIDAISIKLKNQDKLINSGLIIIKQLIINNDTKENITIKLQEIINEVSQQPADLTQAVAEDILTQISNKNILNNINPIQFIILLLIAISTTLWGFGSLLTF